MKQKLFLLLLLLCLTLCVSVQAEGYTVTCTGCTVNGMTSLSFENEAVLTFVADGTENLVWKVNGQTVTPSGYPDVLVIPVVENTVVSCESIPPEPLVIRAVGCTLQFLNENGKADGETFDSLDFTLLGEASFAATANGKKVSYWVLDGIKYDFYEYMVKVINLRNVTSSMTIEAVLQGEKPQTLRDPVPGEGTLTVTAEHGQLCFINEKNKGAGGWFTSVDFTSEYQNKATKKKLPGGLITLCVKATVPKGRKVYYWRFNDIELRFDAPMTVFRVYDLPMSMTYEPGFNNN